MSIPTPNGPEPGNQGYALFAWPKVLDAAGLSAFSLIKRDVPVPDHLDLCDRSTAMRLRRGIGLAVMTLTVASGCSGAEASTDGPGPSRAPAGSGASPSTPDKGTRPADKAGAERVAQRFVTAANAGDEAGVAATF